VQREKAPREGVEYEANGNLLKLFYAPQTQVAIGQKAGDEMHVKVHHIGPSDGVMARVWLEDEDGFDLDRECIGGFDAGGPWVREHRDLERLNKYLELFGLKHEPGDDGYFHLSNVEPVEPGNEEEEYSNEVPNEEA
jgi:hypothetical protein